MKNSNHRSNPTCRPLGIEPLERRCVLAANVVINEIHFHPDDSQVRSEFVELFNAGDVAADIGNWSFSEGIDYQVPEGVALLPGEFYLVAENEADFNAEFNVGKGPWAAYETTEGERGLQNFTGSVGMDFVVNAPIRVTRLGAFDSRSNGFARTISVQLWQRDDAGTPFVPSDDTGESVLAALSFSEADPGQLVGGTRFKPLPVPLILGPGTYTISASGYGVGERLLNGGADGAGDVNDVGGRITYVGKSRWSDTADAFPTNVDVHPHQYGAGSFEFEFDAEHELQAADGQYAGKLSNEGETLTLRDSDGAIVDTVTYQTHFPWPTAAGGGGPSMELIHPSLDNDLGGSWRSAAGHAAGRPSPGQVNAVFDDATPPQIRQVKAAPQQPTSGQSVLITAKVTDPDGVGSVSLAYQVVDPGDYIRKSDERYQTDWQTFAMLDDGTAGDAQRHDSIFTTMMPAELQQHRRLVRFRITVTDQLGTSTTTPYADDDQSNFAYFVYDGVPSWTGADQPGTTETVTYDASVTSSLPAFHLISHEADVLASNYDTRYNTNAFRFEGTLVVDGHVYDHIRYRIRGQNSTYVTGKNKWKIKFNRGHEFQGYDQYGQAWPEKLTTLNFGTAASPWAPANRGLAGMDEALAFRLFNMVGVPAPNLSAFQLRVIDATEEASDTDQYEGDLWGLYLAFENPSGDFMRAHDLPDGNLFRMQNSSSELEHQGYQLPDDLSDLNEFTSSRTGYNRSTQPVQWWRDNVDLDRYYSYRSVMEAINHSDVRDRENMLLYFDAESELWSMLPWDVDLLYEEFARWGPDGVQNASALEGFRKALDHEELLIEFQNRARELQDLLLNDDQGAQLVEEYARYVEPFAAIDRALWDYHPRTSRAPANRQHRGAFYNETYRYPAGNGAAGEVRRAIHPVGFEGMVNWVKEFISTGFGGETLKQLSDDSRIPATPVATPLQVEFDGRIAANDLSFSTSPFNGPDGDQSFASIQWRLGRVHNPTTIDFDANRPWIYEYDEVWTSGMKDEFGEQVTVPSNVVTPGQTYRLRVRHQDATGRWSHWSSPVEFVVTEANHAIDLGIVISEIHYHPAAPTPAESLAGFTDADEFEFLELLNTSGQTIDLTQVELRRTESGDGVEFRFADSSVTRLGPGESVVIVENLDAFRHRYGEDVVVAGQWTGKLANDGETLRLVVSATPALDVTYDDTWFASTDGRGASLTLVDPFGTEKRDMSLRESWRPSGELGGSPGRSFDHLPGDSNNDGRFTLADLVLVFQAGEYEDSVLDNSTFDEGDWNGDGEFTSSDLVFAFQFGLYTI